MANVLVRAVGEGDLEALAIINEQIHALHQAARPDQFKPVERAGMMAWLRGLLDKPGFVLWGVDRIELKSWAFNTDAHAAFRQLGFVPKHVRFELSAASR